MASKRQLKHPASGIKNHDLLRWLKSKLPIDKLDSEDKKIFDELAKELESKSRSQTGLNDYPLSAQVGVWKWHLAKSEIVWNAELYQIFGFNPKEELTEEKYWAVIHPEDAQLLKDSVERAIFHKAHYRIKHRIVNKEGEVTWLDCQGKPLIEDNKVVGLHGLTRISSNILSDSHVGNRQTILSEHTSEVIAYINKEGVIEDVNVAIFEQLEWYPQEACGKSIWEFTKRQENEEIESLWISAKKSMGHEWYGNIQLKNRHGNFIWFMVKAVPVLSENGDLDSMLIVAENTNEQRIMGASLSSTESKFSGISEEISEFAIIALDSNNKIKLWNKGAFRIFKFEVGEVVGKDFLRFLKPSGIEKTSPEEVFQLAFASGQKREWYGWMKVKDDQDFWGHIIINPQFEPDSQEVIGFTLLVRNLSERKFSDARFQSFLEMGSDSIVIIDEQGKIFLVNKKTEETFGYPREELLGKSIDLLVPDTYKDQHQKHRVHYFKNPEARPMGKEGIELYAKRRGGEIFPVEISLSPVETEKGLLVLSSIRDVSQRVENERKLRNAARELNLSYQRLQGIIDSSQDLISAVDVNYNFIAFNRAFKRFFDSENNTNIQPGDNIKVIYSKNNGGDKILEPYWERALKGQEFTFEFKHEDDGNGEKYLSVTFNSIRDQNKRLLGAAHVIRDITDEFHQKEILKRSEEMLNDAQEFARIGSFEYDIRLREVYCSDAVYDLLGILKQDIKVDSDLLRLVDVKERQEINQAFVDLVQQGKPFHKLLHVKRIDDGRHVVLSCSARTRITANGNPGIIGVIQDETKDYQIQKELKEAKERAEGSAQLKQKFVANVSHEIRTPMNAILGFSRFLMEADLSEELKDYATNIYGSAENLLVLIDDILDFSKLEAGKVRMEETDFSLKETLDQIVKLFKLKASQKGLSLELEIGDSIAEAYSGDPYRINQMVVNVVGNAIKFTEKGKISIKAVVAKEQKKKHQVKISVSDTGIGIPKEKLNTIFQSFSQAEGDTTRKYGGSGLGLSIVRNLLEILNGSISVESKVGEGSTFNLEFPIKIGNPKNLRTGKKVDLKSESGKGFKILLAEDNLNNQFITAKLLKDAGFEVLVASNGEEALDLYRDNQVDLILMDIQMPIMDGVEAMKQIKLLEKKNKKETPIIALTAHALIEERERYLAAGMNDYLSKPFKPENLYQVVFSQLGKEAEQNTPLVRVYEEEPKPKNNKPKSNKPVDLSSLREMVGNEQEVVREMLEIFKEDTPIYLENIERELAKENWESVAKTCHTLKSSIGFMGRTDLVEMAKQLQTQKTKPAKNHPIRDTLDTFVSEISKVVQYVEENPNLSEED